MSKAKEEAEAIYNKHYCSILEYGEELSQEIVISLLAKKSALIHVNGIIDEIDSMDWEFSTNIADERREFWHEVKQELNKML